MYTKKLFLAKDISQLREDAQEAIWAATENPDPGMAVFTFPFLHLKEGVALCTSGYGKREGAFGYVWTVPKSFIATDTEGWEEVKVSDLHRPFSGDRSCLDAFWDYAGKEEKEEEWEKDEDAFTIPKPPGALENIMEAIEGDGTPWSYMSASIFARAAAEVAPSWHGAVWATQRILDEDPWASTQDPEKASSMHRPANIEHWKWMEDKPSEWNPSVVCDDEVIIVRFYTYSGLMQQTIYGYTDIYRSNCYKFMWDARIVADGPRGYVF